MCRRKRASLAGHFWRKRLFARSALLKQSFFALACLPQFFAQQCYMLACTKQDGNVALQRQTYAQQGCRSALATAFALVVRLLSPWLRFPSAHLKVGAPPGHRQLLSLQLAEH